MFPQALCRKYEPDLWFSTVRKSADNARATAICGRCPHQADCLTYSLEWAEYGIYGGKTAEERKVIRKERGLRLRTWAA